MNAIPSIIPYEKQSDPQARMCGAACLRMVYRSFGKDVPQAEIWPAIAKVNRLGSLASTTHLMAQDALGRGLAAVAIQARHPIQALRLCHEFGIRAILNHRLEPGSPAGHYSVLVDLDARNVILHDPLRGPSLSLSHAELLDLWQPKFPNSEIVGGVLMAIGNGPADLPPCQFCHTPIPASVECPNCRKPVGLKPAPVLGCMNHDCIARMWNYLCCPVCDLMWNLDTKLEPAGAPVASAGKPRPLPADLYTQPDGLKEAMEQLDKFTDHIKSIPGAADHAEVKYYLDIVTNTKAKLKLTLAEAAVHTRAYQAQVGAYIQNAQEQVLAHRMKLDELKAAEVKAAEPLDGVALGKAALKNLGFTL